MYSLLPAAGILLAGFAARVTADSSFITPGGSGSSSWSNNPTYDDGESMNVEWTTDVEETKLILWQDYPPAGGGTQFFVQLKDNSKSTSMIWQANFNGFSVKVKKGEDAVFHYALYEAGTDNVIANSGAFNVTVPKDAETTTSGGPTTSNDPSPTPKSTKETTTTGDSSPTSDELDSGTSSSDSGLSTGAVAGIAVGSTIGGLAVLGAFGFMLWRRWRKPDAGGSYTPAAPQDQSQMAQPQEYYKPPAAPTELAGQPWIHPPNGPHNNNYSNGPGGLHEAP
ncbi:hypothetical protein FDECE_15189 [Fusarium decemcellulare]|nr:hypothetical protein FDECE_15189 [Fusarium decemcellulare]